MNFLAHIYLSGKNPQIQIGGIMADGIRGKDYLNYPKDIQKGILLHRKIDTFTDAHPIFRQSKHRLHENYGHFSGIIVDVFYDHFLAKNFKKYSREKLNDFALSFYQNLLNHQNDLNLKTLNMIPYMIEGNWLYNYQFIEGVEKTLTQMDHRTKFKSKMGKSVSELKLFYKEFETEFTQFFEEIRIFCKTELQKI
ncbi:DUF479 domain-containing protein [Flavobacterium sp. NST-5]|uniref:DUF479 domain-containing protein n=1 Tax=Flavobacterium ichthyis TaxID=2698827 RepID=A0ABW9Z951_9FLAO|nr:acyl carrier protein phosphodiesterase [Flavobacterium ichthyis]NBL65144.1 DUF479 domain-containing protein [Flavobacterium ichthyis]